MDDFLYHTPKSQHFFSKCVKTFGTPSSYVYLTSPSRKFKPQDGCYETYTRQSSFRNTNCNCYTPTCPASGMNGAYPIGYEIATYIDDKNRHWNMPSRLSILTMQDREDAFKFFKDAFSFSVPDVTQAASKTAFFMVLSSQLKSITVSSTRSLVHLDLIIFTLFYVLSNRLMDEEIFRSYCISDNPWDILSEFDHVWNNSRANKDCWLARFLAYDALNSNDTDIRKKYSRVRLPLIKGISAPLTVHPLAIIVEEEEIFYKAELIGSLVMYGDVFWLTKPTPEFLASRALSVSESRQLLILTDEEAKSNMWSGYLEELRFGRWKLTQQHQEWALWLDRIVQQYL